MAQTTVDNWIRDAKAVGIKSIICLLADDQLSLYEHLPNGLISYYRAVGFAVENVPVCDDQYPPLSDDDLDRVWRAYQALPKPLLVHCSAGVDRTESAVKFIQRQLSAQA